MFKYNSMKIPAGDKVDIATPQEFVRIAMNLVKIFRDEGLTRRDMTALMGLLADLGTNGSGFSGKVGFTWNKKEWGKDIK